MPRYFFDVHIGDAVEADAVGSELVSSAMIIDMALDLCLQIARERMPDSSNVGVHVRGMNGGAAVYQANITLSGAWT